MFGILDYLKIGAGILAGMMLCILFYEGVPVVSSIPYINVIPIVGDLAIGHVQVKVNAAVASAEHEFANQVAAAAMKAQLAAQAESARQAALVTSEYESRLSAFHAVNDQKDKDLDDALAANEKLRSAAGLSCPPDDGTRKLLRQHGFQVD